MCRDIIKCSVMQVIIYFPFIFFYQSIGGSIMTANPTSDLNPVLMAARCTLLVATAGGIQAMLAVSN